VTHVTLSTRPHLDAPYAVAQTVTPTDCPGVYVDWTGVRPALRFVYGWMAGEGPSVWAVVGRDHWLERVAWLGDGPYVAITGNERLRFEVDG
jgi:hypothetical protein